MSRRRRHVDLAPDVRGLPFSDASDSLDDAGERFSSSTFGAPRPLVQQVSVWRRLVQLDDAVARGRDRDLTYLNQLRDRRLHEVVRRALPVRSQQPVIRFSAVVRRPLQAQFVRSSVRGLNRLRMDARSRACVSRVQRRQVLFARRVAGRGRRHGAGGSYSRNISSQWSCR